MPALKNHHYGSKAEEKAIANWWNAHNQWGHLWESKLIAKKWHEIEEMTQCDLREIYRATKYPSLFE